MDIPLTTADVCDQYRDARVLPLVFSSFGGQKSVNGRVETVVVHSSNELIQKTLDEDGRARILVVNGGGARAKYALVGDRLATLAIQRGWAGIVVNGLIRDIERLATMPIGIWARGTSPQRGPLRGGHGRRGAGLSFGLRRRLVIQPGDHLYCDSDGIVVVPGRTERGAATLPATGLAGS
jgi:regulator of ribonuclease activity A